MSMYIILIQLYGHIKYPNCFRWTRIVLFEFISTILLTYGIMCSQYETPPDPKPDNYKPILNPAHSAF